MKKIIGWLLFTKIGYILFIRKFSFTNFKNIELPKFDSYYPQEHLIIYSKIEVFGGVYSFNDYTDIYLLDSKIQNEINKFGWLNNLRVINTDVASRRALFLVNSWLTHDPKISKNVSFLIMAERVFNLILNYPMLSSNKKVNIHNKILNVIATYVSYLKVGYKYKLVEDMTPVFKALIFANIFFEKNVESTQKIFNDFLHDIKQNILNDGCHISRDPAKTVSYLENMLYIYYLIKNNPDLQSNVLLEYIGRTTVFIRSIRHLDASLPLLNSSYETPKNKVDYLLSLSDTSSANSIMLRQSKYVNIKTESSNIVMDIGCMKGFNSSLAFEVCLDKKKVICSLGGEEKRQRKDLSCFMLRINNKYYQFSSQSDKCTVRSRSDSLCDILTVTYFIEEYKIEYIQEIHIVKKDIPIILGEAMIVFKGNKEKILPLIQEAFLRFHFHPKIKHLKVDNSQNLTTFALEDEDYLFSSYNSDKLLSKNKYKGSLYYDCYCYTIDIPFNLKDKIVKNEWGFYKFKDIKLLNSRENNE